MSRHYANDADAAHGLNADTKQLAKLRAATPLPKSTVERVPRRYAARHELGSPVTDLVVDTRTR